jgi:hypothetical protein
VASIEASIPEDERAARRPLALQLDLLATIAVAALCLAVALRGNTRDTSNYIDVFKATREFPWNPLAYYVDYGTEWGFGVLCWALRALGLGWGSLFFTTSALTFLALRNAASSVGLRLVAILPYYLGTFFLTQQLMQVRQGLGVAIAFAAILDLANRPFSLRHALLAVLALSVHTVSAAPLALGLTWRLMPAYRRGTPVTLLQLCVIVLFFLVTARVAMQLQVFSVLERLSAYASDEEYNGTRSLLAPANLRALVLLVGCSVVRRPATFERRYSALLVAMAAAVGLRFGFYDFEILSGRLATAVGFAEVYLLALAVRFALAQPAARRVAAAGFLAAHTVLTLTIQTPFLVHDYFTPVHGHSSSR